MSSRRRYHTNRFSTDTVRRYNESGGRRCTRDSHSQDRRATCSLVFRGECRYFAWPARGAATASTNVRSLIISRKLEQQIDLRFLDRDANSEVRSLLAINGGNRVPVLVFLSEDWFEVARFGERPLSTYRRMAEEQLGPACPTGFVPPQGDAIAAITADWLAEFERSQLILRLSPRLRARYGD